VKLVNKKKLKLKKYSTFKDLKLGFPVVVGLLQVYNRKKTTKYLRGSRGWRRFTRGFFVSIVSGACLKKTRRLGRFLFLRLRTFVGREGFDYSLRIDAPNCVFLSMYKPRKRGGRKVRFKYRPKSFLIGLRSAKKRHLQKLRRHGEF
jgi:hypothetical protein